MIDFRLGRYQDVLQDVTCDAVICDPPYSERVHAGHFAGCTDEKTDSGWLERTGYDDKRSRRRPLNYQFWTNEDAKSFVNYWDNKCNGWMVVITDHILQTAFSDAMSDVGRYVFAPLPFVEVGKCARLNGDGPASWTCWVVVSRPKDIKYSKWGHIRGAYIFNKGAVEQVKTVVGGKPEQLMTTIIRDYSKPGDLICDPCAGGATTLIAAASQGRRSVGAEMDADTYAKAMQRIKAGYTTDMFVA